MLVVLDSLGVGAAPDAAEYGDAGADTLGHIAQYCATSPSAGGRGRPLHIPHLLALGLGQAAASASGIRREGLHSAATPSGAWGCAVERSHGKDTVSGHWEIAGVAVQDAWGYFAQSHDSVPASLLDQLEAEADLPGILGNCHASGTEIIERLGAEHPASGRPIVYVSTDSVLQIAAHEDAFGLDRLYAVCTIARRLVDPLRIGRVIARPFSGDISAGFRRTAGRRDLAVPPPAPTLLDHLLAAAGSVIAVGKIGDIFAGRGISTRIAAHGIEALVQATADAFAAAGDRTLVFTNIVDFDQEFGHRRDVDGYADALERFDAVLPRLLDVLGDDDLLVLTADHGNDPTWHGTDHTREQVPIIAAGPAIAPRSIGRRETFADIGQSLAGWFGLPPMLQGRSFLQ